MELRFVKVSRSDTTRHYGTLRLVKDDSGRVRTQVILDSDRKKRQQDAADSPDSDSRRLIRCPSPVPYTIHSPGLWRSSFVQAMVADLFPKEIGYGRLLEADFAYHFSNKAWTPVVAIHDAMALLHVGSTSNDDTLLLEAKRRYVFTIGELRQALSPRGPQVSAEAILVVSMGLMLCEMYSAISHGSHMITWSRHVAGISEFVSSTCSDSFALPAPRYLLQQVVSAQIIRALYERTPCAGNRIFLEEFSKDSQLALLYDLAARVPPLLQTFDSRTERSDHALLDSLSIVQQDLENWITSASMIKRQDGSSPLDVESAGSGCIVQPDTTRAALWLLTRASLCRTCILLVAECVDTLLSHKSIATHPAFASETRAVQLKRTIQSLARAAGVPVCIARAVNAPLYFLTRYYARVGDTAGLEWCAQFKGDILKSAPWLRWDVLMPWGLLTVHDVPIYSR